jgi:hypothetical protein
MDIETEKLEQIYETISMDCSSETCFTNLLERYIDGFPLLEKFEIYPVKADIVGLPTEFGFMDIYSNVVNNQKYVVRVAYRKVNDVVKQLPDGESKTALLVKLGGDDWLITFMFLDKDRQIDLNGIMGFTAKFVFDYVLSCISDAFSRNNATISGMYYMVKTSESKRIKLYDKIVTLFKKFKYRFEIPTEKTTFIFFTDK